MDLDSDGHLDILSGSYPGELYVFRGTEDGAYAAAAKIQDKDGDDINVGRAAAMYAGDWDGDGDLDLVVGDIRGQIWWLANESGGAALALGEAEMLKVGDEAIVVPRGDAGPVLADWDGNGTVDLIVGCGDGSVRFYANGKAEGMPVLAEPVELLSASEGMHVGPGDEARCGGRVKPCVVDWNGDGRLDLLVGDVLFRRKLEPELTAEEAAEKAALEEKRALLQQRMAPASKRVTERALARLGVGGAEGENASFRDAWSGLTDEQKAQYATFYQEALKKDFEATILQRLLRETSTALRPFRPGLDVHGHVWVLLRRPASS